ncbi:biotin/lipoyl-binding protein [Bifidobacterium olomucense]|uniref:ABC transporter n=1 Tax=Bifidobacterium olomucense TaxID=2675324 RepID=A0A7Y0EWA9_9BIFI|nr:biotin/lipoyl-binding protein [Bifidobacterium sp. DSM 109959]NMM97611.1 ABC transporter [Bifidobacterium sp. DSM 109959]
MIQGSKAAARTVAFRKERRASRNGVAISIVILLALVMLAMGVSAGFLLTRSKIPPSLVSSTEASTVKVAVTQFDDSRSVALTMSLGESSTVASPTSGTVTGIAVRAGSPIASGQVIFDVDATPVMALHTDVPLYRELKSGMRGSDAAGLNAALRRLGYNAPDSDWMTWDTITAYNALAQSVGARQLSRDTGWTIDPSWFVWLPADSVTVKQTSIAVGRQVTAGQDLFTTAAIPLKATLPAAAADLVAGERVITIGDQTFDVPADAKELTDTAMLTAINNSVAFRMASLGSDSGGALASGGTLAGGAAGASAGETLSVSYDWRLKQPLTALSVPPSAVYDAAAGSGCVSVDATPVQVSIIASQLGKTMVSVSENQTFDHVDVTPRTNEHCTAQGGA